MSEFEDGHAQSVHQTLSLIQRQYGGGHPEFYKHFYLGLLIYEYSSIA